MNATSVTRRLARHFRREGLDIDIPEDGRRLLRVALEQTIRDVLALDQDLKDYAQAAVLDGSAQETDLGREIASISDLLKTEAFNPISAAPFIQWYRREPRKAAATLIRHDAIVGLPEENPHLIVRFARRLAQI